MKNIIVLHIVLCFTLLSTSSLCGQCIDNSHSPFRDQSWLSCTVSESPNDQRPASHWLYLDLGYDYLMDTLTLWNYNVWGETGSGVRSFLIDYSSNGQIWNSIGPFEIAKAPGSWKYNNPAVLSLGNIPARYVLITVIRTWDENADCAGIGEVKIGVSQPSSVNQEDFTSDIVLSPNPASQLLRIALPEPDTDISFYVVNNLGQIVLSAEDYDGSENHTLDVSTLQNGIYNLMIRKSGRLNSKSFVKQSP